MAGQKNTRTWGVNTNLEIDVGLVTTTRSNVRPITGSIKAH